MIVFAFRTSDSRSAPCQSARTVRLAVTESWRLINHPILRNAINSKTARRDGFLELWAIEVNLLYDLFRFLPETPHRSEIILGQVSIGDHRHTYVEIYDTWREDL